MATWTDLCYEAQGGEKIVQALLIAPAGFTLDAVNYYTFTVRVRRSGQSNGEILGSTYSLATRTIVAGTPVTIYSDETGTPLLAGDTVWAYTVSAGSPATGFRPSVLLEIQR